MGVCADDGGECVLRRGGVGELGGVQLFVFCGVGEGDGRGGGERGKDVDIDAGVWVEIDYYLYG